MTPAVPFAVLIPSRLRGDLLRKTFAKMPFLDSPNVVIGTEPDMSYDWLRDRACIRYRYPNPKGSVGVAREALRNYALKEFPDAQWFVLTDDNASYTQVSLMNLVRAAHVTARFYEREIFMAGMHSTAPHFDRHAIAASKEQVGDANQKYTIYSAVGAIYHAVPRSWYERYSYPPQCFALEDRHMFMSAIKQGFRYGDFRVCMDAPFSKSRYQEGGQGSIVERMMKCGWSIEQLAHDHPEYVGAKGTFPTPWKFILDMAAGGTADRLVGGAMRKGADIVSPKTPRLTLRRKGK